MSRKQSRRIAFQIIYSLGFGGEALLNDETQASLDETIPEGAESEYIRNICETVKKNLETIDNYITKFSKGFSLDRLFKVDIAILRMGTAEILFTDTPNIVAIDSAVELAQKYSTPKSADFVNGVLASINEAVCSC